MANAEGTESPGQSQDKPDDEDELSLRSVVGFFTEPSEGYSAALFRIAFGVLATWTATFNLLNTRRFYTEEGTMPWIHVREIPAQAFSLFSLAPTNDTLAWLLSGTFLAASVALTIGFFPRVATLCIYVTQLSLQHKNPYLFNRGDHLFLMLALLAAFLPLGKRWSVAALWRQRRGRAAPTARVWGRRLIALQISYVYLYAFTAKIQRPGWRSGEAIFHTMASPSLSEWPVILDSDLLLVALAWGTMAFELLFPLLVWDKKYRMLVLAAGIAFHLGIEIFLTIPMFSAAMLAAYPCFMSDEEALRLVQRLLPRAGKAQTVYGATSR